MLAAIGKSEPVIEQCFAQASEVLNQDLWALASTGPAELQQLTVNAQPLLLTAGVALWRLWSQRGGPLPAAMCGHSLGEFTALTCADSLEFSQAIQLVRHRGELMQSAVPVGAGAMSAIIGLDDASVEKNCEEACSATETVQAVNYNSPGQLVIAGHAGAVERAELLCKKDAARLVSRLPVSAPFHTVLMREAADKLMLELDKITVSRPKIPIYHNVHARTATVASQIKSLLYRQMYSAVRWTDCITAIAASGINSFVEAGPGKVLCGLNRRIDKSLQNFPLERAEQFDKAVATVCAMTNK